MTESDTVPAAPAATVILLRDARNGVQGVEALLLQRHTKTAFHGGAWVFPGGHIDPEDHDPGAPDDMLAAARTAAVRDHDPGAPDDMLAAARTAAVRETAEEAGLRIDPDTLAYFSHWTTPLVRPRRFSTWFFVAPAGDEGVRVDGREISAHRWLRPAAALAARHAGEIELPPPTYVSLTTLAAFDSVAAALGFVRGREPDVFFPKLEKVEGGYCLLYRGDAGYETANVAIPGKRHRLWMLCDGWRYERGIPESVRRRRPAA